MNFIEYILSYVFLAFGLLLFMIGYLQSLSQSAPQLTAAGPIQLMLVGIFLILISIVIHVFLKPYKKQNVHS